MTALHLVEIPDDLAAEAAQVPGIRERLLSFIRAEVSMHRKRQSRHSAQAREIVRRAKEQAEQMKASGVTPEQARAEFARLHSEIMEQVSAEP